jgi:hypothetical protein
MTNIGPNMEEVQVMEDRDDQKAGSPRFVVEQKSNPCKTTIDRFGGFSKSLTGPVHPFDHNGNLNSEPLVSAPLDWKLIHESFNC